MKTRRPVRASRSVSASELAQMGVCEQRVLLEHLHGKRRTEQQRADMARGNAEHLQFYREGRKGRCFIATLVYGEGEEVTALRAFRDRILRPLPTGRRLILAYYHIAPRVCRGLAGRPRLIGLVRRLLRPLVWMAKHIAHCRGHDV